MMKHIMATIWNDIKFFMMPTIFAISFFGGGVYLIETHTQHPEISGWLTTAHLLGHIFVAYIWLLVLPAAKKLKEAADIVQAAKEKQLKELLAQQPVKDESVEKVPW